MSVVGSKSDPPADLAGPEKRKKAARGRDPKRTKTGRCIATQERYE